MAFTIIEASIGALYIHLATTNYYLECGSTIGFSSSIYNAIFKRKNIDIIIGMILSSVFIKIFYPKLVPPYPSSNLVHNNKNLTLFSVTGLLVGLGTKHGCGCTSGHMIGGLSRLRLRSIISTCVFSSVSMTVVYFLKLSPKSEQAPNYLILWNISFLKENKTILYLLIGNFIQVYAILPFVAKRIKTNSTKKAIKMYNGVLSGFLFGLGLHIAGMTDISKTIGFLSLPRLNSFDPSLLMIVLFAIVPNIIVWRRIKHPLLSPSFSIIASDKISTKFLLGNVLFGIGWGLLGTCPGPGLLNAVHFCSMSFWLVSFSIGYYVAEHFT